MDPLHSYRANIEAAISRMKDAYGEAFFSNMPEHSRHQRLLWFASDELVKQMHIVKETTLALSAMHGASFNVVKEDQKFALIRLAAGIGVINIKRLGVLKPENVWFVVTRDNDRVFWYYPGQDWSCARYTAHGNITSL
jgi:hypothetical protein